MSGVPDGTLVGPPAPSQRAAGAAPAARPARPVRVCIVGPSLDIVGGQSVQAARLLGRLREIPGLEVDFLAVNPRLPGPLRRLQQVKYVRTVVTSIAYLATLLRRIPRYDVVHAFSASYWSYLLAPLPALLVGRLYGKQTVLNYHSGEADDHLTRWRRSAVPTMRRWPDAIVVPSAYLVDVFGRHGLRARAILNFVELERLPFRVRRRPRPRFLSNRNFEALYNVRCTLDAFAVVQREVPEAELVLVGDGTERAMLEAHARELGLRNVTFAGRVPPARMGEFYDAADVYLNSPSIDNMPLSIIEAYAAGVPVVTTDAGGIPYIVRHEVTGLMVPSGDAAALAAAALRMLREPGLAERLAARARAEALERYVWPAVRDEWESLYVGLHAGEVPA